MKNKKNILLCVACIVILWFSNVASAVPIFTESSRFSNLSVGSGLSQMSVMRIYQDSKGYIWFGTRNGLNKYDGVRMKIYKPLGGGGSESGLVDRQITALLEDKNGKLWIGTSRGLSVLDLETDRIQSFVSNEYSWLDTGVRTIFIDSRNHLWIGTARGLYLFVPQSEMWQPISLNGELTNVPVTVLSETPAGDLVIGTENKGMFICDPSFRNVKKYGKSNLLPDDSVADVLVDDKSGELWVATANGGVVNISLKENVSKKFDTSNSQLSTNNIRCLSLIHI